MTDRFSFPDFVHAMRWLDGGPMADRIEPYRWRVFDRAFQRRADLVSAFVYSLILSGRAKKNWKTVDLVLVCLFALLNDSPGGNQVYLVANDLGQSNDDLALTKKIIRANPFLSDEVKIKTNIIERRDGQGFIEILPAQDAIGQHGKTYRLLGVDEIHGYRNWDLLEAMALDPTRLDAQQWITSYASLFHRPGAPLFDLMRQAKAADDPRMLVSWYGADWCTDPEFDALPPEQRANPSMASWANTEYLEQQRRRLPAHKFRRLHLNLPGLPEGSAYQPDPVMNAVDRSVRLRPREERVRYVAFVDMSGGSSDDAVLAIAHLDDAKRSVLDRVLNQGALAPFDPMLAVTRFVAVLREYGCTSVTGDRYAGETFKAAFEKEQISYRVSDKTKSEIYEAFEPLLNSSTAVLLDEPELEQQLLGLVWRGGRIDHLAGEHDDFANAGSGALVLAAGGAQTFYSETIYGVSEDHMIF